MALVDMTTDSVFIESPNDWNFFQELEKKRKRPGRSFLEAKNIALKRSFVNSIYLGFANIMPYNPQFESIGQAFIQVYYQKFDTTPDPTQRSLGLADLYDAQDSMLTFEGAQVKGKDQILAKFASLPFKQIARAFTTIDCQPLMDGGILISVLGQLKTDEDPVKGYMHTFVLHPTANGLSFYISNEVFRLVIHNM